MNSKTRLGLAVGLIVLLALLIWRTVGVPEAPDPGPAEERASAGAPMQPAGDDGSGLTPASESPEHTDIDAARGEADEPSDVETQPEATTVPRPAAGVVLGRVIGLTGDDLVGAEVTVREILGKEDAARRKPVEVTMPVDPDGGFRVEGLVPGQYLVTASHPGLALAQATVRVTAEAGAGPLELVLRTGGAILVRTLDGQEQPLADQKIVVSGTGGSTGHTDTAGEMRLERLPPGSYMVRWWDDGRTTVTMAAVIPGETTTVVFRRGAILCGTVLGPDGTPPESAVVRLRPLSIGPEGYRSYQAPTDARGSYRVAGVPPGEYHVDVQVTKPDSYVATTGTVRLESGEERTLDLRVRATLLAGRITRSDDGRPLGKRDVQIAASRVRLEDGKVVEHVRGSHAMAFADEDGRYEFKGLEPGPWELWIYPRIKDLADTRRVVEIPAGGHAVDADFILRVRRLGTLRLRILEPDGGPARRGVDFTSVEEREGKDWQITLRGQVGEDGRWTFALEAGRRRVAVHRAGYRIDPEVVAVEVAEGKAVEATCRLVQLGSILVTVLDATGLPAADIVIRCGPVGERPRSVPTDEMGHGIYRVRVDPGKTTVHVTRGESKAVSVEVDVKAGESATATVRLD